MMVRVLSQNDNNHANHHYTNHHLNRPTPTLPPNVWFEVVDG